MSTAESCALSTTGRAPRLRAELRTAPGAAVCVLLGDLDLHTRDIAEPVLDRALAADAPVVCVDLRDVPFCDSSGLRLLLTLRERCLLQGTALALVAPSHRVVRLLQVAAVEDVFAIHPDCATAVADLVGGNG
ncbi:STAS domain-containing protein [Streptacidiphilus monticola]|uniref:Anti-sigma factor antagonist n=1 Tax=Streptacidiphilus monticola TaxID=2161674 RepID=A0ABW1FZM0_9ACTN